MFMSLCAGRTASLFCGGFFVMSMDFQRIAPLWDTFPTKFGQSAGEPEKAGGSVFKDIFQSVIDNVRDSEDNVAKQEYLLSTGQMDNPAQLSMALYKAEVSMQMFVQLREKALSAYNEISRISL